MESKTIVHDKIVEEHESHLADAEFIDSRSKDELLDGKNADSHLNSDQKISEEKAGGNTSDTSKEKVKGISPIRKLQQTLNQK